MTDYKGEYTCYGCGHIWDGDEDKKCPRCDCDAIGIISQILVGGL